MRTQGGTMKVKDEDGKVREVNPRSIVGSQLISGIAVGLVHDS